MFHEEKNISLSATELVEAGSLSAVLAGAKGVNFIVLNLKNSSGKVVSHNVYWLSGDGNYKSMNEMQKTKVDVKVLGEVRGKNEYSWTIQVRNSSDKTCLLL